MVFSGDFHHAMLGDSCKPAVLFLHGFMGRGSDWAEVAAALVEDHCCISVDLPGHGETTWDDQADWDDVARAVLGVLDRHGIEVCSLVGYSMGGRLGLYLALEHPRRFRRALLESASPGLATDAERAARRERDEALARDFETVPLADMVRRWYGQPLFATMHQHPERLESLIETRIYNDAHGLAGALRTLGTGCQPSLWARLASCRVPLLFLAGDEDRKFTELAERMAECCPRAGRSVVSGSGHNVHWENAPEYTRRLKGFLASDG